MQRSNTLSQEIVGLFDTVRKQADAYVNVFELLTRKSYELDRQRTAAQKELVAFKAESERCLQHTGQRLEDTLTDFAHKIHHIEEIYGELEQIRQFREELQELKQVLENRSVELDTIIHSIRAVVKKEADAESAKIERRVATKLMAMENDLATFDSRLYSIQEFQKREVVSLGEEIDRFKNKIAETKYIVEETTRIVNDTIERAEGNMGERMLQYNDMLDKKVQDAMKALSSDDDMQRTMRKMGAEVLSLYKRTSILENKSGIALWIAIGGAIAAIAISLITRMMH